MQHERTTMWGSGSQSPLDFGSQSQGGLYGLSQESGFGSQSQSPFDLSQSQYSQSQSQQLSQPSIPECTECQSTEIHTTDDGDMVSGSKREREEALAGSESSMSQKLCKTVTYIETGVAAAVVAPDGGKIRRTVSISIRHHARLYCFQG